jgi:hypothetical protein
MKKSTLLILFLTIFAVPAMVSAQETSGGSVGPDGKREGHWVITGRLANKPDYKPDAKVEEGNYKAGLKEGVWIQYYPNGNKKGEYTFVNNRANGPATTYFENGNKQEEGTWVVNRWVGPYKMYYENGTTRQEFNYNQIGKRDGKQVYRNPDGSLQIEVTEVNGKEEGLKKEYDEHGNLLRETYFNGGAIDPSKTKEYPRKTAAPTSTADKVDGAGAPPPPPPPPPAGVKWNGEGQYTLMRGGQVSQKGVFHLFKLVDGEVFFYDDNGMLVQIRKYKGGKYVGDSPIPADANK